MTKCKIIIDTLAHTGLVPICRNDTDLTDLRRFFLEIYPADLLLLLMKDFAKKMLKEMR
jgi:hypothetical protein